MDDPQHDPDLETLVQTALEVLGPEVHCSVTMRRGPGVHQVASTDPRAEACDRIEVDEREGPCVAAMDALAGVLVEEIATEVRWPRWCEQARASGFVSAVALPAWVDRDTVIAINVYSEQPDPWDAAWLSRMDGFITTVAAQVRAWPRGSGPW